MGLEKRKTMMRLEEANGIENMGERGKHLELGMREGV